MGKLFSNNASRIPATARLGLVPVLALGLLSGLPALAGAADIDQTQQAVTAVVDAVKPALVRIHVVSGDCEEGREVKREAFGSGVIISPAGDVITNHHVAGHAEQITCTLADKTEVDAKLVGTDPLTDIAVIKLMPETKHDFPTAKFGDSSKLKVGDRVFAMGSPLAFSQSVTMGIVSNTELIMPDILRSDSLTLDGEDVGSVVRWIAHDAEIHPGNSGGPLVNMQGEIVGINEIELGLGGAIPGNLARQTAEQLMSRGKVSRSWIGISIQPLLKSSPSKEGILVDGAMTGSPAQKAQFRAGDILIRLDGKPCGGRFKEEIPVFNQLVLGLTPGKQIEAVVLRDGKEVTLNVTPTDRAEASSKEHEFKEWGMCASGITFYEAKEMKRPDNAGAVVTSIRQGGPADDAKPKITEDDVITSVGGKPVKSTDDLRKVTSEIVAGKTEPVPTIVSFDRNLEQYVTVVKLGVQNMEDPGLEVRKAWLPVNAQVLTTDIAEAMGLQGRKGFRITHIYPGTSADQAKLKIGDIIVALDGSAIEASEPEDIEVLDSLVRQYKIGSTVKLTVLRAGKEQIVQVKLPESPKLAREMRKYHDERLDVTVRDICFFDKVDEKWPQTQTGVLATDIGEGGWAALGELSTSDLIIGINGKPIKDVASYESAMKALAREKPKTLVLSVKRGIHDTYVEITPVWGTD